MKNKYTKLIVLFISIFVLSGCVNVKRDSLEDITNYIVNNKRTMVNHVNKGFKYYIPRGLSAIYKNENNEIIRSNKYDYYLYVDLISYFNKEESSYELTNDIYYSKHIKDEKGLLNITKKDNKYLIQIDYNYAHIEVLVYEKDIKVAASNALIIVSSIDYNSEVIRAMLDEGVLSLNEKPINVFKTNDDKSDLLEMEDEEYEYHEPDEKDRDYIN